jgi:hypothetical protein
VERTEQLINSSLEATFWTPRASSVFDFELQNTELDTTGVAWGPNEPKMAYEMAQLSLTAISDHFASIHKLLQPPLSIFGQAVLARSIFESAGFGFWMTDPGIDVRTRVARAYSIFWEAARTHLREARKHGAAEEAAAQAHFDSIKARIAELGFNTAKVNNKWIIVECGAMPTKTSWVEELFAGDLQHDYTKIYSPYSGVTHGEITALLTRLQSQGGAPAAWTIEPRQLAQNVELPLVGFRTLFKRLSDAGMGIEPNTEFEEWKEYVADRMNAIHQAGG